MSLRLNGIDENKAMTDTIAHFDELNSAMGEIETETQENSANVYVSGTPVVNVKSLALTKV